jgi:hypothetical protein
VLRRDPAFTIQKWLQLHQFVKQADADRASEGLRVAGFPELVRWHVAIAQRLAMSELVQRTSSLSNRSWYESGHWRDAGRRSNVDLLGDVQSIIDLDPEILDGALQLRMAQ